MSKPARPRLARTGGTPDAGALVSRAQYLAPDT